MSRKVSDLYYRTGQRLAELERELVDYKAEHKRRVRALRAAMRDMEQRGDDAAEVLAAAMREAGGGAGHGSP